MLYIELFKCQKCNKVHAILMLSQDQYVNRCRDGAAASEYSDVTDEELDKHTGMGMYFIKRDGKERRYITNTKTCSNCSVV